MDLAIRYALSAMICISFAPSLVRTIMMKYGLTSTEILFTSTLIVNIILFVIIYTQGKNPLGLIDFSRGFWLSCLLGLIFGTSLLFYYAALAKGAVTLVVPIWGLQIVMASLIAIPCLGEAFNFNKFMTLLMVLGAIFFATR
jgi:transporter family protein